MIDLVQALTMLVMIGILIWQGVRIGDLETRVNTNRGYIDANIDAIRGILAIGIKMGQRDAS